MFAKRQARLQASLCEAGVDVALASQQAGVDGSVTVETYRTQVGNSFIITQDGWKPLTHHPKSVAGATV